jgi:hypothetical protein
VVRLHGPQLVSAGQDIELVAELQQFVGSSSPVELKLVLPPGVRLVSGSQSEQLPSGNAQLERRFVIHVDRVPDTDVELTASAGNLAFGAHARGAYRFGRKEPRLAVPPKSASELKVGGKSLGHPIQLK